MPAGTAWPIILAFGIMLCFASLVTNVGVGLVGSLLTCCGIVGWFKQVFPQEQHEFVPLVARKFAPAIPRTKVAHIQVSEVHRAFLPVESYPIHAGLRG